MRFFDFCAGIGAGRLGLERAGMNCVGFSEISRNSIKTYSLLHDTTNEEKFGNLTKINPEKLDPICYDSVNHTYRRLGDVVGKAFSDGKKLI